MLRIIILCLSIVILYSYQASAEDIALSFVHKTKRINIPRSAISNVKLDAITIYRNTEIGELFSSPPTHNVQVCLSEKYRKKLCNLTRRIVDEEMPIIVDCETIAKPVVREPLCTMECFLITTHDTSDSESLAGKIRKGSTAECKDPIS